MDDAVLGLLIAVVIVIVIVVALAAAAAVAHDVLGPRRRRPDVDDAALRRGVGESARHRALAPPPSP